MGIQSTDILLKVKTLFEGSGAKQAKAGIEGIASAQTKVASETKKASTALTAEQKVVADLAREAMKTSDALKIMGRQDLGNLLASSRQVSGVMQNMRTAVVGGLVGAFTTLAGINIGSAFQEGVEGAQNFEKAMSKVALLTATTDETIASFRKNVKQMSADTLQSTSALADVQVVIDGRHANSGQLAFGYVQSIVGGFQAERLGGSGAPGPRMSATTTEVRHWYNPNLESRWFVVPSLVAVITTIGCLIVTALSVAREREQGTLDQVLVSPLTPAMIMFGKAIPAMLVATVQATIIIIAARLVYGLPFTGSMILLYACILIYSLSLAGFGLLISAISQTQQQAFLGVFIFMLPGILLSGFVSPVENMPAVLQWISWADPLRHFIPIVTGLFLKSYGPADLLPNLWPMLVIAAATLAAAYVILRKGNA